MTLREFQPLEKTARRTSRDDHKVTSTRLQTRWVGLLISNALVWFVIPATWLLASWTLGPYLGGLSLLLIPLALLGMSCSMFAAGRVLLARAARKGVVDAPPVIRWRPSRSGRRRVELVNAPAPTRLPIHVHALAGLVLAGMMLVAVGLITVVPLGFVWLASQLAPTTAPGMWPYLVVGGGIAFGAAVGVRLLIALHRLHCRLTGQRADGRRVTPWLRSLSDTEWVRDPGALVEWLVVFIVVIAVLAMAVWLFVAADPTRLVPQELHPV